MFKKSIIFNEPYLHGNYFPVLEIIRPKVLDLQKRFLFVFDVHGTLLEGNWKSQYVLLYRELFNKEPPENWIMDNIYGKTDAEIIDYLNTESGTSKLEIRQTMDECHQFVHKNYPLTPVPGALDSIRLLKTLHAPFIILSGSDRDVVVSQLGLSGFLEYIPEKNIICSAESDCLALLSPHTNIILFDDWINRVARISQLGGIACGLPQGTGLEYVNNRKKLITAGVNYIVQSICLWPLVLQDLIKRNIE